VGTVGDTAPVPHRAPVAEYVPGATLVAAGLARQYDHILEPLSAKVYVSAVPGETLAMPRSWPKLVPPDVYLPALLIRVISPMPDAAGGCSFIIRSPTC